MKLKTPLNKVHRNFKISPALDKKLRSESAKKGQAQTAILEKALAEWFSVKR